MKKIILNFERKTDNFKALVQEAFNMNLLNFMVSKETYSELNQIERVTTFSRDIALPVKNLVFDNLEQLKSSKKLEVNKGIQLELKVKADEQKVIELAKFNDIDFIIVSASDWKIIPFENLIAQLQTSDTELIASVENLTEAELMLKTLEIGTDGILITPHDIDEILELKKLSVNGFNIELTKAKVINLQNIPESERVCVDTTSLLKPGEGMLVGSTAKGFTLVHAEVFETQFVSSRPFRVNAGDVSAYILVPSDKEDKLYETKYLSELKGGDRVLVVNANGEGKIVTVGRVKIETRPMIRLELEIKDQGGKTKINYIGQNAETIRLVSSEGVPISIVDIKIGDEVLAYLGPGATHFGTKIKETIIEK